MKIDSSELLTEYKDIVVYDFNYDIADIYLEELIRLDCTLFDIGSWNKENFLKKMPDKDKLSKIILLNDLPIGYLICSRRKKRVHIHRLGIRSVLQKKGLGRRLMMNLFKDAKKYGVKCITVETSERLNAEKFYISFGFKRLVDESQIIDYLTEHNRTDMLNNYSPPIKKKMI